MSVWKLTIAVVVFGMGLGGITRAADDADALKKKRQELRSRQDEVLKDMADLRRQVEKSEDLKVAQAAVAEATRAYDAKVAGSAKLAESKKALDELTAKTKATVDAELANSPQVQAAQQAIAAAEDAAFEAESQHRIAEYVLSEMKRKVARDHALDELRDKGTKALEGVYAAKQGGKDAEAAQAERTAAHKAFEEAVAAKLDASPAGAAQAQKITELAAKAKELRAAVNPLHAKLLAARTEAGQSNPKIAEARKAVEAAYTAQRKVAAEEAGAERAALDKATVALEEAIRAKLDADPKAVELRKALEGLREKIKEVSAQLKAEPKAN